MTDSWIKKFALNMLILWISNDFGVFFINVHKFVFYAIFAGARSGPWLLSNLLNA